MSRCKDYGDDCKDCGDDWNQHVPIGFCLQDWGGFDQCGCDSLPEGAWFTPDSLAAALEAVGYGLIEDYDTWERRATVVIQAAKEAERQRPPWRQPPTTIPTAEEAERE